jgi:hypothetical protein
LGERADIYSISGADVVNDTLRITAYGSKTFTLSTPNILPAGDYPVRIALFYMDSLYAYKDIRLHVNPVVSPKIRILVDQFHIPEEKTYGDTVLPQYKVINEGTIDAKINIDITNTQDFELIWGTGQESGIVMSVDDTSVFNIKLKSKNVGNYTTKIYANINGLKLDNADADINVAVKPYDIKMCTIAPIPPIDYIKGQTTYTPAPVVKRGNVILVKDTDYTLTYSHNEIPTTSAQVAIKGIGNYTSVNGATFTIKKREHTKDMFYFTPDTVDYDGEPHQVVVKPKEGLVDEVGKVIKTMYNDSTFYPLQSGNYDITINVDSSNYYNATTTPLSLGTFTIKPSNELTTIWDSFVTMIGGNMLFVFDYEKFRMRNEIFETSTYLYIRTVHWWMDHSSRMPANDADKKVGIGFSYMPGDNPEEGKSGRDSITYRFVVVCGVSGESYEVKSNKKTVAFPKESRAMTKSVPLYAYPSEVGKNQPIKVVVDVDYIGQNIEVYNTMGTLIFTKIVKETTTEISINEAPGMYFIKVDMLQTKVVIK